MILQSNQPRAASLDLSLRHTEQPENPRRTYKLLVADDDEAILSLITTALTEAGYDVDSAANGLEAWEAILRTDYNLVITDVEMPHLTGLELMERIRELGTEVPIVVISATLFGEHLEDFAKPVTATLQKPFCMFQLLEAVHEALSASKPDVLGPATPLARHAGRVSHQRINSNPPSS